jgi:hypothetical protein
MRLARDTAVLHGVTEVAAVETASHPGEENSPWPGSGLPKPLAAGCGFGAGGAHCCAAYGAATSAAASKTTRATTIRVVDYYASEPDKSIVGGVLNSCGKAVGVKINRDAIPART